MGSAIGDDAPSDLGDLGFFSACTVSVGGGPGESRTNVLFAGVFSRLLELVISIPAAGNVCSLDCRPRETSTTTAAVCRSPEDEVALGSDCSPNVAVDCAE